MNWKMPSAEAAGTVSGSMTFQNTWNSLQPSTLAESPSSAGNPMKNARMRKMPNGRPRPMPGKMTAQ